MSINTAAAKSKGPNAVTIVIDVPAGSLLGCDDGDERMYVRKKFDSKVTGSPSIEGTQGHNQRETDLEDLKKKHEGAPYRISYNEVTLD